MIQYQQFCQVGGRWSYQEMLLSTIILDNFWSAYVRSLPCQASWIENLDSVVPLQIEFTKLKCTVAKPHVEDILKEEQYIANKR